MPLHTHFGERYSALKDTINKYSPACDIVAVTKYQDSETTKAVIEAGLTTIGESRLEGITAKAKQLRSMDYSLHMIGHLQSRKTADVCTYVDMIQSVDSLKLARKINAWCQEQHTSMDILLQCNITKENQKYGFTTDQLDEVIDTVGEACPHIALQGLMCMGKLNDQHATREVFRVLRTLCTKFKLPVCSMGMSGDREIALQEGSTMLRIGSYFFE